MESDAPVLRSARPLARKRTGAASAGDFTFGIEEEYFLADAETLQMATETPDDLFGAVAAGMPGRISREFLQAQAEVATQPQASAAKARAELIGLRQTAAAAAAQHGLAIMACGTHPTGRWPEVVQTAKRRYDVVMDQLQMIGQRNLLCGMHVHVELPDPRRRVDVMTRMLPYIPLFLALSTSSPFWQSHLTGLKGYRLAAYDELPRTGLPELFRSAREYERYVAAMVKAGAIQDASHIWWAIRISPKYPTLELRAPDCCTRVRDALAIASLFRCLVRRLCRDPEHNAGIDVVARSIAVENKWRAQRYGAETTFVTAAGPLGVGEFLERALELTVDDAEALNCAVEISNCRAILAEGTSADVQLSRFFEREPQDGSEGALRAVKQWIAAATLET
jgi:carboxylate-amine ligase